MTSSSNRGWQPCPDGEFGKLSQRLIARSRRRTAFSVLFGVSAFLAAGAAIAAVTYQIAAGPTAHSSGGSCAPPPSCATPNR